MSELAAQYPRYGYRRIRIFLGRDGHQMSFGRAYRLWKTARLQVPRKRPQAPSGANQVWSYDFVFDWCANGQKLKCLTVTDEWTKEGLAIEVDGRIRSPRVIEVLSRLVSERGAPLYLRSDNGPEFVSRALLKWIVDQGIGTALIDPGKPWQNGATESLIGKFRDECLSLEWFRSRAEAKVVIEGWRRHYNEVRPHSSLGYLTPAEFVAKTGSQDAASRPATGRTAAVRGASALRPVASPSRKGQTKDRPRAEFSS
jgi:putative transposase